MTEMRALLRFPAQRKLVVANCPVPEPGSNGLLVKTGYSLVSPGTEFQQVSQTRASLLRKAWQRPDLVALVFSHLKSEGLNRTRQRVENRLAHPLPMGYCAMGRVVATGDNISRFTPGQRVAIAGMGSANHAEWNRVPVNLACLIPDAVSDQSAPFATLYALALHSLRQGETVIGHQIAVIGAGLIGRLVAETAYAAGAKVTIIEPDPIRRHLASESSTYKCTDRAQDAAANRFDSVYICTQSRKPHRLIDEAAHLCRDRGIIVCVGDVPPNGTRKKLYEKEITIHQTRSYGPGRYDPNYEARGEDYPIGHVRWTINRNMEAALDLMADGRLDPSPLITSEIGFSEIADHFATGSDPSQLGTLVRYDEDQPPLQTTRTENLRRHPRHKANTENHIKLGLIGAGNYLGGSLLPILRKHDRIQITACCSQTGLAAVSLLQKLGGVKAHASVKSLLEQPDINSVLITTRHDSHAPLAAQAVAAGKHVWVEKPLAIDHAGLNLLREHAHTDAPGRTFMVGHNRRYAAMSETLREKIPTGIKQFRYRIRTRPLPSDHWVRRSGQGGRTIGEISHFIDLIISLTNSELVKLTCQWIDRKAGDSIWQMVFADGSYGEVSYLQGNRHDPKEMLEIDAPNFTACLLDWKKLEINGRVVMRNRFAQDKGQAAAIDTFARAITSTPPPVLIPSIMDEIDLMARILRAANTGIDQKSDQ